MKRSTSFNHPTPPLIQDAPSLKKARSSQQVDKVGNFSQSLDSHGDQDSAQPSEAACNPNRPTYVPKKEKAIANSLREIHFAKNMEASAIKNLELALEAKDFIRDTLYNKHKGSFKSGNKMRSTNDWIDEAARITRADQEIFLWSNGFEKARNHIWTAKGHKCDELALAAHDWLAQTKSANVCMIGMGDHHTATVVGELPNHALSKDMTKWPAHLSICDPWLNVACLAKDYPARFKEKMQKWENDDKSIEAGSNWISPLDPAWIKLIDEKKTLWHPDFYIDPSLKEPPRECN